MIHPIQSFKLKLLATLVTYFCLNFGFSQNNVHFEHITTNNGLSQSDVNSIYQDNKGFLWFGTHEGLNKFDGYNFKVYTPNSQTHDYEGISSSLIFAITGDDDDNLWVGTTGDGLNYFDTSVERFKVFKHEDKNPNSLISNHISSLFRDSSNKLWIGTFNGLDMIDLNKGLDSIHFNHFNFDGGNFVSNFENKTIYSIFEDKHGQIWVGGARGLYKLSRDSSGELYLRFINELINLPYTSVRCIAEDQFGRLLIGTVGGLYVLKNEGDSYWADWIHKGFYNDILVEKNNIWAGTNSGLISFKYSGNTGKIIVFKQYSYDPMSPMSLSKNIVKSLYKDKTGIIWIGTNGGGVNKFDPYRKDFKHIKKTLNSTSLSYDKIRSLFEDSNGTLWIGTEGGGLNMLLKANEDELYTSFQHLSSPRKPFTIYEVKRGDRKILLIGTEGAPKLLEIDITNPRPLSNKDVKKYEDVSGSVFALLEDKHKNLWIGTYNAGINRWLYDSETNSFKKDILFADKNDPHSLSSNIIRNILEDHSGNLWFATGNGLCKLTPNEALKDKPKFEVFQNDPKNNRSISHNYILELFESSKNELWIGTFGGGLNKFIPSKNKLKGEFVSYLMKDGLPNNVIKGILEDDQGFLWLSTNKGLSKFDPKKVSFKNYDMNDGLQNNEFQELARLKRRNGEMLFGGINGFNAFFPENIKDNHVEAETVITKLSVSNQVVNIGDQVNGRVILEQSINQTDKITLKHNENNLSFEFGALHYASPDKNKFAYILEGFDEDWVYTTSSKRFATYTNLSPGTYTLKVKASNNDGIWDKTPSEIKIEIIPPFWRTTWAYLIYYVLIIGLLLLFRRYTVISTTKKHQLELEHFEKEKSEELQKIKLEFFTNISHELRTPLTLIKGPLKYLQKNGDQLNRKVLQEQYTLMQKNCDYLLRLVNQLLDFRKINQGKMRLVMRKGNIVEFIKEVCEPFQFLSLKNHVNFQFKTRNPKIIAWFDHDVIEKILNNLLSNAFNYTPDNGEIRVEINTIKETVNSNLGKRNLNFVEIQVIDSGLGIESNRLENIFERFYTENNQARNHSKGVGIGLAFVKDIVELHQGKIHVISEINKGSTFTVHLPIEKEAYEGIPEIICKDVSDSDFKLRTSETDSMAISMNDDIVDQDIDKSRAQKPVLLVVDDNEDIRSFLKQALYNKYIVYEAENGKVGLELAGKIIPNVILTDILMPEMDGIEFCKHVKNHKETSHIPVIILTAKLSQEDEIEGLKTGADDYIRKPFDIELLELKLKNIVNHRNKLRNKFNSEITFKPKDVTVTTQDEQFLQQAIEIVEKHMMNTDFNVEMLVKEMGLSRSNLYLKFKEITGLSSSEFIRNIRLKRAVQLFQASDYSVKEIMYMTGFNTASYFAKCFKKQFGVIPSDYVRKIAKEKASNS
ncbi:response regulator [Tamlana fucoidanivorans]|uniref:histidine kinase n=1 Tax=Allotamlana fucoidanivorans TaxID=2583814 RepID=A0A5C4SSK0_9FLAO|nr:hybrid sensor histidine kinase/response regulator transcription factor [Tamlana fucoidanivorans]TNJ46591.1 response regulator [Tamlana fucoidanivorans]